jgi:hypothetical protein
MTWVLGSAVLFGYGALIADTRVSWDDGRIADILLKVHPVGSMLMAGFSGSVELGFRMIEDMRYAFESSPDFVWYPRRAALYWWRRGRRIYRYASPEAQKLKSSVILVGTAMQLNGPWHHSYCVVMNSPDFQPKFIPTGEWASIGSGRGHHLAHHLANFDVEDLTTYGQFEAGSGRGGLAWGVAQSVQNGLIREPMQSVSEAIVVGHVFANEHRIGAIHSHVPSEEGYRIIRPRTLADSWPAFCSFASQHDLHASRAVA